MLFRPAPRAEAYLLKKHQHYKVINYMRPLRYCSGRKETIKANIDDLFSLSFTVPKCRIHIIKTLGACLFSFSHHRHAKKEERTGKGKVFNGRSRKMHVMWWKDEGMPRPPKNKVPKCY